MQVAVKTICLCFVLLFFSGCTPKQEIVYIYKKYPKPKVEVPIIEIKCNDVRCVLINYQKQKDYAGILKAVLDEVTE